MDDRKDEIERRCISLSVGKLVRRIGYAVRAHQDRGRSIDEEARDVLRRVIRDTATEELGESAVFLTDTPERGQAARPEWVAGEGEDDPELELLDFPEEG